MKKLQLSEDLDKEYIIKDNKIRLKESEYKFKSDLIKDNIIIPARYITLIPFSESGIITRICKKISHNYLLKLKDKYKIEFDNYNLILDPSKNKEKWGYLRVSIKESGIIGDGEIHQDNLKDWDDYSFTILYKRAEDRAIARYLGLYSEGFLTESENIQPSYNEDYVNYEDIKTGEVKTYNTFDDKNNENNNKNDFSNGNYNYNKLICILHELLIETNENFNKSISKYDSKGDINNLSKDDLKSLLIDYEEKFGEEEQLFKILESYIKNYKIDQNWTQERFKKEISKTLLKDDIIISELTIDDLYDIILDWDL